MSTTGNYWARLKPLVAGALPHRHGEQAAPKGQPRTAKKSPLPGLEIDRTAQRAGRNKKVIYMTAVIQPTRHKSLKQLPGHKKRTLPDLAFTGHYAPQDCRALPLYVMGFKYYMFTEKYFLI